MPGCDQPTTEEWVEEGELLPVMARQNKCTQKWHRGRKISLLQIKENSYKELSLKDHLNFFSKTLFSLLYAVGRYYSWFIQSSQIFRAAGKETNKQNCC